MSFWRFLHLLLAVLAGGFIFTASITGAFLAFEPISEELHPARGGKEQSLAEFLPKLEQNFDEIYAVKINDKNLIEASILDSTGEFKDAIIDPVSGKELTNSQNDSNPFFDFNRTLHRSLFLENTGRFVMGVISIILLLIAFTGIALVKKRQLKWRYFFSKIQQDSKVQFYHTHFGRLLLLPILIIALSGIFLFLKRFEWIPQKQQVELSTEHIEFKETKSILKSDFSIFQEVKLADLNSLEYPFSPEIEDYFYLTTQSNEYFINQFDGSILVSQSYGDWHQYYVLSFDIHTGKIHPIWAMVLFLASIALLYFLYSGYKMWYLRSKGKIKNKIKPQDAEFVVLYGSENGSTKQFATAFFKSLQKSRKNCYITSINQAKEFPKMKELIVLTATYGDGDAPANSNQFVEKLEQYADLDFHFSVLGFGSHNYPDFCAFAIEIDSILERFQKTSKRLDLFKIHNKNETEFKKWMREWTLKSELDLIIPNEILEKKTYHQFKMLNKSKELIEENEIFQIELEVPKKINFQSGDLVAIQPRKDEAERFYSIAKTHQGRIQISIKLVPNGICSNYLAQLKIGDKVQARIQNNPEFNLPKSAQKVICIANGTGIGPFLGSEFAKIQTTLFWGMPEQNMADELLKNSASNQFQSIHLALSRESKKEYVQDLIKQNESFIVNHLETEQTILICGSIKMRDAVFKEIEEICDKNRLNPLEYYQSKGLILEDCY